eukprot:SAG31_NODE_188_length_20842_cov_31.993444_7_plen_96_part_00
MLDIPLFCASTFMVSSGFVMNVAATPAPAPAMSWPSASAKEPVAMMHLSCRFGACGAVDPRSTAGGTGYRRQACDPSQALSTGARLPDAMRRSAS